MPTRVGTGGCGLWLGAVGESSGAKVRGDPHRGAVVSTRELPAPIPHSKIEKLDDALLYDAHGIGQTNPRAKVPGDTP